MITRENYSIEHIMDLHESSKRDPILIERVLFAFGLLETLRRVELPFKKQHGDRTVAKALRSLKKRNPLAYAYSIKAEELINSITNAERNP